MNSAALLTLSLSWSIAITSTSHFVSHFYWGAKTLYRGAKNFDRVLICIKIGSITHICTTMLIQFYRLNKLGK